MAETLRQSDAFDCYYKMGSNRSYEKVALATGVSKQSIYKWAKQYKWKERIAERDKANAAKIFEATDETIVESMISYRKIIKASIGNYVKQLKDGVVKINSPSEFIKLAELDVKIAELIENKSNIDDTNYEEYIDNEVRFILDSEENKGSSSNDVLL